MVKNGVIILNDLRSVPIISVLKMKRAMSSHQFIAHQSLFKNKEYADHTNLMWKAFQQFILKYFFGLKIIKSHAKELDESEKMGFYSSLFSITEDSSATEEKYPKIYNQIMKLALGSKDVASYLKENQNDLVFIFNGRTASSYLVSKYCVTNKINLFYYEYAGHCNGFRLFPVPPHASGRLGELYLQYFKNGIFNSSDLKFAANLLKVQKLNSIFKERAGLKSTKTYDVVIFLGSDFEYTAVDPEICEVTWSGNLNFCKSVIEKYGTEKSYVIRCHPNSESDPNWLSLYDELILEIKELKVSAEIIAPNSLIDSHDLINNAEIVVTDLSTISLDSILLGKPTDIFGNTDIRYIYTDPWFNEISNGDLKENIINPFALVHNFLVFRFSKIERKICFLLFLVHASFSKYSNWKSSCSCKN